MRVAIVHDWLVQFAGAERVLRELIALFPDAHLYTLVDFLPESSRNFLRGVPIHTSFIQRLPFARSKYRLYLPLMPLAVEAFDLREFDLIISSHHCVAKGVILGPDQIHICYCHSPIRYAWDLQHEYFDQASIGWGLKGMLAHFLLHKIRKWDRSTAGVDHFIAVSKFIQRRIHRIYRRDSQIIHPPVDVESFEVCESKADFYLTASRMVPYKRLGLVVEAFNTMPDKKLVVIGDGPQFKQIASLAGKNTQMLGFQKDSVLRDYLRRARGFIFPAKEDFGILPVEALACGTPVIGFQKGGVAETVIDEETGLLFQHQSAEDIKAAVMRFETMTFSPYQCRRQAEQFGVQRFKDELKAAVEGVLDKSKAIENNLL